MSVSSVARRQVIDQVVIDDIRDLLERAERGEVVDIVVVAEVASDGVYVAQSNFGNGWRVLGALEFAKAHVHRMIIRGESG
ncbi:hypothetical protein GCM10011360_17590 [Primorskyibacter flagellatus]|uniref:Uncharacterized protein n=1 Tax=Primorskyibacter flagellatus TaxID=1387277 RepID=A0A917EEQ6_9RHOB|nr:hypothetical protein [Primorskyibacter flagellatus]GGE29997.1 hypothetical protein GCM10011360_17590 [Primorskyibacter flagellatus]